MNGQGSTTYSPRTEEEKTQRVDLLRVADQGQLNDEQKDELERSGHPLPGQTQPLQQEEPPAPTDVQEPRTPSGDSRHQLEDIQRRNEEIMHGAVAGPEGERKVGVGRTVSSEPSQTSGAPA